MTDHQRSIRHNYVAPVTPEAMEALGLLERSKDDEDNIRLTDAGIYVYRFLLTAHLMCDKRAAFDSIAGCKRAAK